jgi:pimeloyl-ACP methyl ester carboxylesterase
MLRTAKKILSLILTAIMVVSVFLPASAAAEYEEYPTIYVTGAQTNDLYSAQGEKISDFTIDIKGMFGNGINDLLSDFAIGLISDNYKQFANDIHKIFIDAYGKSALDKNGEASNGSHPANHSSTVAVEKKSSNYDIWDYRFWYDWRISPLVTGEELEAYIDRVLEATGETKVNLVGRCYGANVIAAYVALNEEHAKAHVADIGYFAPSVDGIDFMTALYTGEIYLDPEALDNFANWFIDNKDLIEDEALVDFIATLLDLFEQAEVLGFTADKLDLLVDRIKTDILPPVLRDSFASWPSYWAMVTDGNLEKAIDFIFGDCKDEYAGFIQKVRDYYTLVQVPHNATLGKMMSAGVRYNIFAKYNFPEYPIYKGAAVQSDGDTPIPRQTFGATSANYGKVLSDDYIASISEKNLKYLSPDLKIDASTGLLPENTWYIKNLHHNHWAAIHDISLTIMNNDYNVSDNVFPQFMDNNNNLAEVTPDEDYEKPEENTLMSLFRFLTAFFNLLAKVFRGEINLKEMFSSLSK